MRNLMTKGLVLAAVLSMTAAACNKTSTPTTSSGGGAQTGGSTGTTMTIMGEQANNKGSANVSGQKSTSLEADTENSLNYFKPTVLEGTPGQKITLVLKNESSTVKHNFTLADQNLNVDLAPGATKKVTVTFPQSGGLEFHCEYHQSLGMVGELKVM